MKFVLGLAALLALGWGVTSWKAARNEARAHAAHPPLGGIVDVGGTPVHYLQMGDGPDLALIHGASGNLRDFSFDLMGRLAERYRVTAFDRPGLGHTGRLGAGGASIRDQAALLAAASGRIGLERPLVLGHSYGGAVALAWAVDRPDAVSGLILLAAASHPWETPLSPYYRTLSHPVWGRIAVPLLSAWAPDAAVARAIARVFAPQGTPEGYDAHVGAALALRRASLRENALQRAALLAEVTAMVPFYPQIAAPVEILHGTEDTTVGLGVHSEPLARAIPGANLVAMRGVGHSPHHADPEAAVAAIDRAATRAGLR